MKFYLLCFIGLSAVFSLRGQRQLSPDVISGNIQVKFIPENKQIIGSVAYTFWVKSINDTLKIDARNLQIDRVSLNNVSAKYDYKKQLITVIPPYQVGPNKLVIDYHGQPKQALYFWGDFLDHSRFDQQIWTQGQGKYSSNWVPSFDDPTEKVVFSVAITADSRYQAYSNGSLQTEKHGADGSITWQYAMEKPMSSYLLMLAVGQFWNQTIKSKSGVPIAMYVAKGDEAHWEPTYRHSKEIFDILEAETGVPYPWKVYRQIPVRDFLYAGMENTTSTLFAQDFVVDSIGYNDRRYSNVNAHELAHQWFGDLVTAHSGKHHWLQEGFATYFALLAERKLFGDDYFYYQMYRHAVALKNNAKHDSIPILSEKASSLSYYQKGAWALFDLHQKMGDKKWKKCIRTYLKKYAFGTVTTDDFLKIVRETSQLDTDLFQKEWLESAQFPWDHALELLQKNAQIKQLLQLQKSRSGSSLNSSEALNVMTSNAYYPLKNEVLFQFREQPFEQKKEIIEAALDCKDLEVRQALAEFIGDFPEAFRTKYEQLLSDPSYETQEIALMHLWKLFPDQRKMYLERFQNIVGLPDKSLRITFLTLAIGSDLYNADATENYREELEQFCTNRYETSVRQEAITNLLLLHPSNETALIQLMEGLAHFKWQFVQFTKEKLKTIKDQAQGVELLNQLVAKVSLEAREKAKNWIAKN